MKIRGKQTGGDIIPHNMILYKNTKDQSDLIEEHKKYLGSCQVCDIRDNIGNNIEIIRPFLSETVEIIKQKIEDREKAIPMLARQAQIELIAKISNIRSKLNFITSGEDVTNEGKETLNHILNSELDTEKIYEASEEILNTSNEMIELGEQSISKKLRKLSEKLSGIIDLKEFINTARENNSDSKCVYVGKSSILSKNKEDYIRRLFSRNEGSEDKILPLTLEQCIEINKFTEDKAKKLRTIFRPILGRKITKGMWDRYLNRPPAIIGEKEEIMDISRSNWARDKEIEKFMKESSEITGLKNYNLNYCMDGVTLNYLKSPDTPNTPWNREFEHPGDVNTVGFFAPRIIETRLEKGNSIFIKSPTKNVIIGQPYAFKDKRIYDNICNFFGITQQEEEEKAEANESPVQKILSSLATPRPGGCPSPLEYIIIRSINNNPTENAHSRNLSYDKKLETYKESSKGLSRESVETTSPGGKRGYSKRFNKKSKKIIKKYNKNTRRKGGAPMLGRSKSSKDLPEDSISTRIYDAKLREKEFLDMSSEVKTKKPENKELKKNADLVAGKFIKSSMWWSSVINLYEILSTHDKDILTNALFDVSDEEREEGIESTGSKKDSILDIEKILNEINVSFDRKINYIEDLKVGDQVRINAKIRGDKVKITAKNRFENQIGTISTFSRKDSRIYDKISHKWAVTLPNGSIYKISSENFTPTETAKGKTGQIKSNKGNGMWLIEIDGEEREAQGKYLTKIDKEEPEEDVSTVPQEQRREGQVELGNVPTVSEQEGSEELNAILEQSLDVIEGSEEQEVEPPQSPEKKYIYSIKELSDLKPGIPVIIKGIQKQPELNGQEGLIINPEDCNPSELCEQTKLEESGRLPILIKTDSSQKLLKKENLEVAYNGKYCVIEDIPDSPDKKKIYILDGEDPRKNGDIIIDMKNLEKIGEIDENKFSNYIQADNLLPMLQSLYHLNYRDPQDIPDYTVPSDVIQEKDRFYRNKSGTGKKKFVKSKKSKKKSVKLREKNKKMKYKNSKKR